MVSVDLDVGTVYFRVSDGRTGRNSGWAGEVPRRGDLFLMSSESRH